MVFKKRIQMKWIVIISFAMIFASLGSALIFMFRDKGKSKNMVKALGMRVGLSIALFLFLLFSHHMGWIEPTGIPMAPR
jgi:formate hydrogenlyase subunit 3/multisubunit Na+/H+ antiporter MnhD subunit